ncbi:MAG: adenylate/guanylate cyclase domain-containing protein [Cytophagales bacterium]|nr:MAG: adenylate/guanylate cyclase domain-containing protein [Cytophagales bacterium]
MKKIHLLSFYFSLFSVCLLLFSFQIDPKKADADIAKALKAKNYANAIALAIKTGEAYTEAGKAGLAEKYYTNALLYATTSKDKKLLAFANESKGDFLLPELSFANKIQCYQAAEKLYRAVNDKKGVSSVLQKLLKYSFEQKNYGTATKYGNAILDSATYYDISEFKKLNLTKALITISMTLRNEGETQKYLQFLNTINKEATLSTDYNADIDLDEEILKKQYSEALSQTTPEIQKLINDMSAPKTNTQQSEQELSTLQQREIEAKWQKEIISKQEELSRLKDVENQRLIIGIIGSLLIFAISVVALIGRQMANKKLEKQNAEIEKQKAIIDEERRKAEDLLLNILPKEIADELKEKGYAMPRSYELVTVLFTDFKGFTQIAEKITPQQTVEKLNFFFQKFDEIAKKYNLEKIKTLGDGYMCAGGVPNENSTNPIDTVRAALEMQKFMNDWNKERKSMGEATFELRLGINTGALVAGVIGTNKFAYDIWGDTVNLASRMESSGEVGKVNISGATYEWVRHQFECTYRGKVAAKNKGEVDMYFVEREIVRI